MIRPRLLLVEDHRLVRDALEQLLARVYDIVGSVERGDLVVGRAAELQPELVVLDVSLPVLGGMFVLPDLRVVLPHAGIVVLTLHDDPLYRETALHNGADELVVKTQAVRELLPALRDTLAKRAARKAANAREP